ncbi:MAG TPA: CapA family protein [Acidimicrobiia bacterium]|nr:CapA family protein [Acidimicrobiia bacterium]
MHFLLSVLLAAGVSMTTLRTGVIAEEALLEPGGTFFDDDGNIHESAIEAIARAGITRGCEDPDLYCPDQSVTRGQMAAFLVRALGLPPAGTSPFEDDDGSVFESDIAALAAAGITRGCDTGRYCPEDPVTRGEMAAFLARALDLESSDGDPFVDDDGSVFERDIAALAGAGITVGCNPPDNTSYCPTEDVRRDHMASFLARALGLRLVEVPPRPSVTMAFSGDVLIHTQVSARAAANGNPYDFTPMFAPVSPIIESVDIAICHLEVPLSANNRNLSGYPTFNAPRQVADGLAAAGYDGCSTASNHSFDQGVGGVGSTLSVLADSGLQQAGMATAVEEAGPAFYSTAEATVAHLSATWWLNGLRLPEDQPWLVQMLEVDSLLEQARDARDAGADVVVVSMHCCTEYQVTPTPYQREVARALIESPEVDLVIGHHAHVVQPVGSIGGEYIFYGLGNSLSAQRSRPGTQDGMIVTVEFVTRGDGWSARTPVVYPTWVEGRSYRILEAASANPASWRRTAAALRLEGAGVVIAR